MTRAKWRTCAAFVVVTVSISCQAESIDSGSDTAAADCPPGDLGPVLTFSQELIDTALAEPLMRGFYGHHGGRPMEDAISIPSTYGTQRVPGSAQYLALVARLSPGAQSSSGQLVVDRVAEQIHYFLQGSADPKASHDVYNVGAQQSFDGAAVTAILAIAKKTPAIWDRLSADDKNRADWYMRMAAVIVNFRYNDGTTSCNTTVYLQNSGGTLPNQRADARELSYIWIYFGGADQVNAELAAFDFDDYVSQFRALGWQNNAGMWTQNSQTRSILENGGTYSSGVDYCQVGVGGAHRPLTAYRGPALRYTPDCPGSTAASTTLPYTATNVFRREEHEFNVAAEVVDQSCWPGADDPGNYCPEYGRLLGGAPSPYLGQIGMFLEFNIGERSSPKYVTPGAELAIIHYAVLASLGHWDGGTPEFDEMSHRMWIAMNDLMYKREYGWFDNVSAYCGPRTVLEEPFWGGDWYLDIWDTMFQDTTLVWDDSPTCPDPDPGPDPSCELRVEAESGSRTGAMRLGLSPTASGGRFVHVPNGAGYGETSFSFDVAVAGSYIVRGRVAGASGMDNSFRVIVDGSESVDWHFTAGAFHEEEAPGTYSLSAGTHIIVIQSREDGSRLDTISLHGSGACAEPSVEAESGLRTDAMQIGTSATASGGQFVHVPNGAGYGEVSFTLPVATAGLYVVRGRVGGANGMDNSFRVSVDGSEPVDWHFTAGAFHEEDAPPLYSLSPGTHTVVIQTREDGSQLDTIGLHLAP